MKIMILCDMDGTLTPARCKIEKDMIETLNRVLDKGYEIGVVSGSGLDYMNEQLSDWDRWSSGNSRIKKYPVNGTNDLNMKSYCGEEVWDEVLEIIFSVDNIMRCEWEGGRDIRLPMNIIQERGSAINWCPIGRDADMIEREKWVQLDEEYNFRNRCLEIVKNYRLFQHDFTIKLGGETSFDIYPKGWDKSYVFRYYEDYDRVYFVGDRCEEWGNDRSDGFLMSFNSVLDAVNFSCMYHSTIPPKTTLQARVGIQIGYILGQVALDKYITAAVDILDKDDNDKKKKEPTKEA